MNSVKELLEYLTNAIKIWVIVQPWEQGIRVRHGHYNKILTPGIHFKIPYFDSVYVQEVRLRMIQLGVQTLSTKDDKTLTVNSSLGYSIEDIKKVYDTIYHPEATVSNMALGEISDIIFNSNLHDLRPAGIEQQVSEKLDLQKYGLRFESLKIIEFAAVRTLRLMQEQSKWIDTTQSELTKKR